MFFLLFNAVFNVKLYFKLKIDQKCVLLKTWKKFEYLKNFLKKRVATLLYDEYTFKLVLIKKEFRIENYLDDFGLGIFSTYFNDK